MATTPPGPSTHQSLPSSSTSRPPGEPRRSGSAGWSDPHPHGNRCARSSVALLSNVCSQRSGPTQYVSFPAATDARTPEGCARHTTVSSGGLDHCGRWDRSVTSDVSASSRAVVSQRLRGDSVQVIISSKGRARRCARYDPSTGRRESADSRDAGDLDSTAVGASDMPRSTIPGDRSLLYSNPRRAATFPAARDRTTRLATAKVTDGNY